MIAGDNLPGSPVYAAALCRLAAAVNGVVYAGDRLNAVVDTVRWLRAHPQVALFLLGLKIDICGESLPLEVMPADGHGFPCVRPPGHSPPHMNTTGATWGRTDEQLEEIVRLSR